MSSVTPFCDVTHWQIHLIILRAGRSSTSRLVTVDVGSCCYVVLANMHCCAKIWAFLETDGNNARSL